MSPSDVSLPLPLSNALQSLDVYFDGQSGQEECLQRTSSCREVSKKVLHPISSAPDPPESWHTMMNAQNGNLSEQLIMLRKPALSRKPLTHALLHFS